MRDKIVILEEGNCTHLHWTYCDMFPPWTSLNQQNSNTALCQRGAEWKNRILVDQEAWEGAAFEFKDMAIP